MTRSCWEKIGIVAGFMAIIHIFPLFSSEGQAMTVVKTENLIALPGIEGRVVMVSEGIWKEHYENRKKKVIIPPTKQSSTDAFNAWAFTLDPLCPEMPAPGINDRDHQGFAPVHYLVLGEIATPKLVGILQSLGTDITLRSKITDSEGVVVCRWDAHRHAIKNVGGSRSNEPIGRFFESQCLGNEKTTQYVFTEILFEKLSRVIDQRKREEMQAALKRRSDILIEQEIRKSLGLPLWPEEMMVNACFSR